MRSRTILLACTGALAIAAGALAATAAPDPVKLALQRSDLPPTVENHILGPPKPERMDPEDLRLHGTGLKGADYSYSWPGGKNAPAVATWVLEGKVIVAPSRAAAQKVYQDATKPPFGLGDLQYPHLNQAELSLPSYGEEQLGIFGGSGGDTAATVFVRKANVVWGLTVYHYPNQWKVTRAQVLAQLKLYARKQSSRLGGA